MSVKYKSPKGAPVYGNTENKSPEGAPVTGNKTLEEVAEFFNMEKDDLVSFLKENGVFENNNLPKQKYIDQGYFQIEN